MDFKERVTINFIDEGRYAGQFMATYPNCPIVGWGGNAEEATDDLLAGIDYYFDQLMSRGELYNAIRDGKIIITFNLDSSQ